MKSLFDKKKIKWDKIGDAEMKLYELSHAQVFYEAQAIWNSSNIFILSNTFLAAFIGTNFTNNTATSHVGIIILSILGILLSCLWFLTASRTANYYRFRLAQAKQKEPEGWMIFNGDGENFADGDSIEIEMKRHNVKIWFNIVSLQLGNLTIIKTLSATFIVFYFFVLFISFYPVFFH
jgi:hypothetical protein